MSREEMDTLLDEGLQFAVQALEKCNEFHPFAVVLRNKCEVCHVYASNEFDKLPSNNKQMLEMLQSVLKRNAFKENYVAVALIFNVSFAKPVRDMHDAVCAHLEHIRSQPIVCYLPYKIKDGVLSTGDVIAQPGQSVIFTS